MSIDPDALVKAALIEDEEDKRLREEAEKAEPEKPEVKPSDEEAPAPKTNPVFSEEADEDDDDEEEPKGEEKPKADPPKKEDAEEEPTGEDGKPLTRKEKREAKKQAWLESVRKERTEPKGEQPRTQQQQQPPQQPRYNPIDYRTVDEINEEQLEQDRRTYGELSRRQGIEQGRTAERFVAEQQNFWTGVEYEAKVLGYDPEFKFLDENNQDTFDPDLAADLNEKYLEFVGFDPNTNTVRRTDISYEKFVRNEVAERKAWAERLAAESEANLSQTKANAGLRPGGNSRKSGLGTLKPGDISKMSDDELAKYEDEIDRQILSAYQ